MGSPLTRGEIVRDHSPEDATLTGVTHGLGRVLVVDDDEVIRRLIAVNLQLEGFDVETAVDGQDCLERVAEIDPDVITLDVMMPRLDGWETAVQLRKSPETAHIKVVLITARAQEADKNHARRGHRALLGDQTRERGPGLCRQRRVGGPYRPPAQPGPAHLRRRSGLAAGAGGPRRRTDRPPRPGRGCRH